jgi:hypothetical protein
MAFGARWLRLWFFVIFGTLLATASAGLDATPITSWLPSVLQSHAVLPATAIIAALAAWSIRTVGELRNSTQPNLRARVAELAALAVDQVADFEVEVLQDALMEVLMPAIASLPAPGKREREEPKQEVPWRTCSGKGGSLSGKGGGATTSSGDVELKEDHMLCSDHWYAEQPRSIQLFVAAIDRSEQKAAREASRGGSNSSAGVRSTHG